MIVRRERLGLQPAAVEAPSPSTGVWLGIPVHVVEDSPQLLATYVGPGARFDFPDGLWPTADGTHPWLGRTAWEGHGCLMLQVPGEHLAVWHFWNGDDRAFSCWYLNLQTAFVRTEQGYDTQDLELDYVVFPDGSHIVKDADVLDQRIAEGRYSAELIDWVRSFGADIVARLGTDGPFWDTSWTDWQPDPSWTNAVLPADWNR